MGAFCIIVLKKTAQSVAAMFSNVKARFRDASEGACDYFCTLEHCFDAIEQAIRRGWFKYLEFNVKEYETMAKFENGDVNWIILAKFLAFSAPSKSDNLIKKNYLTVEYFM